MRYLIPLLLDDRQLIGGSHDLASPISLVGEDYGVAHTIGMLVDLVRSFILVLSFLDLVTCNALLNRRVCPLDQVLYSLLIYRVFF